MKTRIRETRTLTEVALNRCESPSRRWQSLAILTLLSAALFGFQGPKTLEAERAVQSLILTLYESSQEGPSDIALDEIIALSDDVEAKLEIARTDISASAPHMSEYIDNRARVLGWFIRVALWCPNCEEQPSKLVSQEIFEERFAAIRQTFLADQAAGLSEKCEGIEIRAAPSEGDSVECIAEFGKNTLIELRDGLRQVLNPDKQP